MLRKWNRFLAIILAFALVTSTFNSNLASVRVAAGDGEPGFEEPAPEPPAPEPTPEPEPEPAPEPETTPETTPESTPAPTQDEQGQPEGQQPANPEQTPADNSGDGNTPANPEQVNPEGQPAAETPESETPKEEEPEEKKEEAEEAEEAKDKEADKDKAPKSRGEVQNETITITYEAGEGGYVSPESAPVAEDGTVEGSTATAADGYEFVNWTYDGEEVSTSHTYTPDMEFTENMTFKANFKLLEEEESENSYIVTFMVDSEVYGRETYDDNDNQLRLLERPFKQGYFFTGWMYDGSAVTEGMLVDKDMTIEAQFQEIKLFGLKVVYYYENPSTGVEFEFDSSEKTIEKRDFDVTINSPSNVSVTSEVDEDHPVYYPEQESVTFTMDDIDYTVQPEVVDGNVYKLDLPVKRVKFIPYNVHYIQVYLLKDIEGEGYSEVGRDTKEGNLGQMVTPEIKKIEGGIFERAESMLLERENQVLEIHYTRANYVLTYHSNGGTFIDSVAAPYGSIVPLSDTVPTKKGYEFEGWFYDEEFAEEVGETIEIKKDTDLYAKWTAVPVDYTVVYLVEDPDDDGFSYFASVVKQAEVGATVTETAASGLPSGLDSPDDYEFKESTSQVVKADGTTVIQVKISRKVYTISWNGDVYNGSNPSSPRATGQGSAQVTAKYGANITQAFTTAFNDKYPDYAWCFTKTNNDKFVNIITMPSINAGDSPKKGYGHDLNAFDFSTTKKQQLNYWLENYEGAETTTRNGKTYGLYKSVTTKFNYLYDYSEFFEIVGYSKDGYTATYESWGRTQNYTLGNSTPNALLTVHFYYEAHTSTLAFYDYDGTLITTYQVKHNADITGYMNSSKPDAPIEDATWLGWYTDSEHQAIYEGNGKMTEGLALYANWSFPSHTITFMDGSTKVLEKEYEYNQMADSITLDDKVGFTFGGWFTDASCTHAYNFAKPMTEDVTVYAKWVAKDIFYTVKYIDAETGEELADDKVVMSPVFKVGDTKTESAITITGRIPDENTKSIVLEYENNVITFEYSRREGEITYTVEYVLKEDHNIHVHESKTVTKPSTVISVTEVALAVDKQYMRANHPDYADADYYPEYEVLSYNLSSGTNVITFEYNPYASGRIEVYYLDMAGNPIIGKDTVIVTGKAGVSYSIDTNVSGYTLNKITDGTNEVGTNVTFRSGTVKRYVYLQKTLVIRAHNKHKEYDGTPLVSSGIGDATAEGLLNGHTLSQISYRGSQTEGGSSATTPYGAVIAGAGTDDYYKITYVDGTLTVTKKTITVYIEGDQISRPYDGVEHSATYRVTSISDRSFLEEYIQFNGTTDTVSLTHVGYKALTIKNMFSVVPEKASTFNVTFMVSDGYVEITKQVINVWTETKTKVYDGTPLMSDYSDSSTWKLTGLVNGETLVFDGFINSITDVGTVNNDIGNFDWENSTAQESDYRFTWSNGTLTVTEAPVVVTVKGNKETVHYDGNPHTVTGYELTADNDLYDTEQFLTKPAQEDASATGTNVGTYPMGIRELTFDNNNTNFDVSFEYEDGELEIVGSKTVKVNITGHKLSTEYDGTEKSVSGYDIEIVNPEGITPYSEADIQFNGNDTITKIEADTYPMRLAETDFSNKNANYTVEFEIVEDGELEITKKAVTVTIVGNTAEKVYNREEQSVSGYSISISDDAYTEADFTKPDQSVAAVGTAVDEYELILNESDFVNNNANYEVTFEVTNGKLNITKRPVTVTITGDQKTYVYNGTLQKAEGYTVDIDDTIYTEADFSGPAQADAVAALQDVGPKKYMYLTADLFTNNDDNFEVDFQVEDGWVEITPITDVYQIKVIGNSDTVEYNGEEQSVTGYTTEEEIPDDITFGMVAGKEAIAKGTNVGEYEMDITPEDFTATSDNYSNIKIIVEKGKLTIKPGNRPDNKLPKVTGYEGVYDAREHGITISEEDANDTFKYSYMIGGVQYSDQDTAPVATHVDESVSTIIVSVSNPQYKTVELAAVDVTILKKDFTVQTDGGTKAYDGTPLTVDTYTTDGLVNGETVTISTTGTVTEVNEEGVDNEYDISWDSARESDYNLIEDLGKLKITQNMTAISFRAPDDNKIYDGKPLSKASPVMVSNNLPAGFTAEASASGEQIDAGTGKNEVTSYKILDADGNDKTASFGNISLVDGKLTVNPKPVVISTGSASKAYDGTPLKHDVASIEELVEGESVTLHATGEIIDGEPVTNTYSIVWDNAKKDNYEVTENLGTLKILDTDAAIILTAGSGNKIYDGTPLIVGEFTISGTGVPANHTITATIAGSQTDADSSENVITEYKIFNSKGEDRTAYFTGVELVTGTLTVNPAPLTVTTGTARKVYDGTPLTNSEANLEGLVEGDEATVTATGELTEVNEVDNTYEIQWGSVRAENYDIKENLGTLTVILNSSEIIFTAASQKRAYDGTPLTNAEVTATGIPEALTFVATAEGTITDVGTVPNRVADGYAIMLGEKDVTDNFTGISTVDGELEITPLKVTVTITGEQKSFKYDGAEHSVSGYTVETSDPLYTEDDFTFTGTAEAKATVPSTEKMNLTEEQFTNNNENFEITFNVTDGFVTITPLGDDEKFVLEATVSDVTRPYTGEIYSGFDYDLNPKSTGIIQGIVDGISNILGAIFGPSSASAADASTVKDVTVNGHGYKVSGIYVTTAQKDAGEYVFEIDASGMTVLDSEDRNVTGQFKYQEGKMGTLTIEQAPLLVTTPSATKVYDATPLTAPDATLSGLVNNEIATVIATGSQTLVGNSENGYTITWETADPNNYAISEDLGRLTVTAAPGPGPNPNPNPDPGPGPGPGPGPVIIDDPVTPLAATPTPLPDMTVQEGEVLGARRQEAAVLGARRARTEDETNSSMRLMVILISAAVAATLLITGRKREDDEQE